MRSHRWPWLGPSAQLTGLFYLFMHRAKNISAILVKSVVDTAISAICYYLVGYAFTVGQGIPVNGGWGP